MNTLLALFVYNNLLLSTALQGGLWTLAIFTFCFVGVHIAKLARYGWEYQNNKNEPPSETKQPEAEPPKTTETENKKAPEQTAQEPIYYIVERKQRRSKPRYGEPKEIRFK